MKTFNFLLGIGNIFLGAFVSFKVYGWFYQEVGFELPPLTYLNVFALACIISIFKMSPGGDLRIIKLYDKQDFEDKNLIVLTTTAIYFFALLLFWLLKLIIY